MNFLKVLKNSKNSWNFIFRHIVATLSKIVPKNMFLCASRYLVREFSTVVFLMTGVISSISLLQICKPSCIIMFTMATLKTSSFVLSSCPHQQTHWHDRSSSVLGHMSSSKVYSSISMSCKDLFIQCLHRWATAAEKILLLPYMFSYGWGRWHLVEKIN